MKSCLPFEAEPISLGEGGTPLRAQIDLENPRNFRSLGKDKAQNPTQSFKARGMAVAVSMETPGRAAGCAAGNAGGALQLMPPAPVRRLIFMPSDTPLANVIECRRLERT